jgi:K+/H+ antiporter YhaU regulatory subunit KhtT
VLTPESSLDEAAAMMEYDALDELPITEATPDARFVGLVARADIVRALNRVSLSISAVATREDNILWASGYRVSRINVPEGLVGRTLREIDLRSRFGVTVLAVQDQAQIGAGFEPSRPDRPFRAGDLLITAGHPSALRRFARELDHRLEAQPVEVKS